MVSDEAEASLLNAVLRLSAQEVELAQAAARVSQGSDRAEEAERRAREARRRADEAESMRRREGDSMRGDIAQLHRELEEARRTCCVCLEKPLEVVCMPCGHMCLCEEHSAGVRTCPICRRDVSYHHKVFT